MSAHTSKTKVAAPAQPDTKRSRMLALQCVWDIEAIAQAVTQLADEVDAMESIKTEALLRCYSTRIATLNSLVMEYIDGGDITAERMHRGIFGYAKPLEEAAQ